MKNSESWHEAVMRNSESWQEHSLKQAVLDEPARQGTVTVAESVDTGSS